LGTFGASLGLNLGGSVTVSDPYVWDSCTFWYEDEVAGSDSHLIKEDSISNGSSLSWERVVKSFEACSIAGEGIPTITGTAEDDGTMNVISAGCPLPEDFEGTEFTPPPSDDDDDDNE
jgi:hypothetical protein